MSSFDRLLFVKPVRHYFSIFIHPQRNTTYYFFFYFFNQTWDSHANIWPLKKKINHGKRQLKTVRPGNTRYAITLQGKFNSLHFNTLPPWKHSVCEWVCWCTQICMRKCLQALEQLQNLPYNYVDCSLKAEECPQDGRARV